LRTTNERSLARAASPIRVLVVTAVPRFISIPPSCLSLLMPVCFWRRPNCQYLTKNGMNQVRGMAAEYAISVTHDELAFKRPIGQHTQINLICGWYPRRSPGHHMNGNYRLNDEQDFRKSENILQELGFANLTLIC
jgi:hypothetical protein